MSDFCKSSVMLFGDSNTWGFDPDCINFQNSRFTHQDRWTTKLSRKVESGKFSNQIEIIPEGLNCRTSVYNDPTTGMDGEYDCNGRTVLTTLLHTHKPLSIVVIALCTNDLRVRLNNSAEDVVAGIRVLIHDVKKASNIGTYTEITNKDTSTTNSTTSLAYKHPEILVLSPPLLQANEFNVGWGVARDATEKSMKVAELLESTCKDYGVSYLNIQHIPVSAKDGIHFPLSVQGELADVVYGKLCEILETRG